MRGRPARIAAMAAAVALVLAGCATSGVGAGAGARQPTATTGELSGTVTVLAAASLTEVMGDIAARFEKLHPNVTISQNFGGSSALAAQITQGAPADLFASANEATMRTLTDAGLIDGTPVIFATNVLTLIVPPSNPAGVTAIADLANPAVKVALCDVAVPCGSAAMTLLGKEKVTVKPVTLETDVKAVLTKVELGEVDAGLVYATDAATAGHQVTQIPVADADTVVNRYPIAVLKNARNARAAKALEQFILSKAGLAALSRVGFGSP